MNGKTKAETAARRKNQSTEAKKESGDESNRNPDQAQDASIAWSREQAADVPGAEPVPPSRDMEPDLSLRTQREEEDRDYQNTDEKDGSNSRRQAD